MLGEPNLLPDPVTIDYPYLAFALVLLWLPRQWLRLVSLRGSSRGRPLRARTDREPGDISVRIGEELGKSRNWVDLLRAVAGSIAICRWGTFAVGHDATRATLHLAFALKATVLVLGLLIQTLRFEGRFSLFAPLFYVLGLSFGLIDWKPALFAVISIWAVNLVLPSAAVFLFVFGGLATCFGLSFPGSERNDTLLLTALAMLPVLLSVLSKRRLAQFTKKTKIIGSS